MADRLTYPCETIPEPGELFLVAPGIYWLRFPLPFALDHINLWLLEDGDGWTLIDTGIGQQESFSLWEALIAGPLSGRSIHRIVVTHFHPDHIGCAAWLSQRFGAEVLMTRGEFEMAQRLHAAGGTERGRQQGDFFLAHGLDERQVAQMTAGENPYRARVPELPAQYRCLTQGERLSIGGRDWQVLVGCGHSPEHAALYCAEGDLLISGDQLLPRISTNVSVTFLAPQANPLQAYLSSLRDLAELPDATLTLPAHGRPFLGVGERIAALEAHHRERLDTLQRACDRPKSAAEVLNLLFQREFSIHELFFAMGEAVAHFHYLHAEGALEKLVDDQRRIRFVGVSV